MLDPKITQEERDRVHKERRQRLRDFIAASPKIKIRITKALGPYRKGDEITITAATGNNYIKRGHAIEIKD